VLALLAAIAAATNSALDPAHWEAPSYFVWPARGTITTPFVPGGHPGIDIGVLRSLTIRAAAPGRVELVGDHRGYEGYGRIVLVDVGGGYATLYAHLATFGVRAGEDIRAGQRLGLAGCTGWCTGMHLHFEVRLHGRAVDPLAIPMRAGP
jgi:murein DD-endopeptidase MepM/ murein hydrolase activator NlpD